MWGAHKDNTHIVIHSENFDDMYENYIWTGNDIRIEFGNMYAQLSPELAKQNPEFPNGINHYVGSDLIFISISGNKLLKEIEAL